jgi:F-type H+-transporting ATPase subunit alpha
MQIKAEEISKIIEDQIKNYEQRVEMSETGTVLYVGDGIARVYGVQNAMAMELLEFPGGVMGMVLNLEEDNVGVALLGSDVGIKEGDPVKRTGKIFSVPVGDKVMGRVLNPLGQPIDGLGPVEAEEVRPVEIKAPGIIARKSVHEPMPTGLKAIDAMTPIGRGQRELIIGDRQTGKTAVCIDAILAQKETDIHCFYVPSARRKRLSPWWPTPCASTVPWNTPPSSRPPLPTRLPCSTSRLTPVAPWPSTTATTASMP